MDITEQILNKTKKIKKRYDELEELISAPEIIAHNSYWRKLVKEQKSIEDIVFLHNELVNTLEELEKCQKLLDKAEFKELLEEEITSLNKKISKLTQDIKALLLPAQAESSYAEISIKANPDSGEFCGELIEMYRNFAEKSNFEFKRKLIAYNKNQSVKNVTFIISGEGAYSKLKGENGKHKAEKKEGRQSCKVLVMPQIKTTYEFDEKDVKTDVFHASGAGGQHVNKVETAIRLTHIPTGIVATCQDTRSQLQNKEKAIQSLLSKVEEYYNNMDKERYNKEKNVRMKSQNKTVRIYDYIQNKVIDKRVDITDDLDKVMEGNLDNFIDAMVIDKALE